MMRRDKEEEVNNTRKQLFVVYSIRDGTMSVRYAALLLDCTVDDVLDLCHAYSVEVDL